MTALAPLTRLQINKLVMAAGKAGAKELSIADKLAADPSKKHFAWRASNAALFWFKLGETLDLGEDRLSADQRTALAFLESELRIKRRKPEASA